MGVSGLLPLLKDIIKPITFAELRGKTICIDGYFLLHRAISPKRVVLEDTNVLSTDNPYDSINRSMLWCKAIIDWLRSLTQHNIDVIVVFDGLQTFGKQVEGSRKLAREEKQERGWKMLQEYVESGGGNGKTNNNSNTKRSAQTNSRSSFQSSSFNDQDKIKTTFASGIDVDFDMALQLIDNIGLEFEQQFVCLQFDQMDEDQPHIHCTSSNDEEQEQQFTMFDTNGDAKPTTTSSTSSTTATTATTATTTIATTTTTTNKTILKATLPNHHKAFITKPNQNLNNQQFGSVDWLIAPYEADSQLTYLVRSGICYAALAEDSDLIALGCSRVLFKTDFYSSNAQLLHLSDVFSYRRSPFYQMTLNQLQYAVIISGCDYTKGIHGYGMNKGIETAKRMCMCQIAHINDGRIKKNDDFLSLSPDLIKSGLFCNQLLSSTDNNNYSLFNTFHSTALGQMETSRMDLHQPPASLSNTTVSNITHMPKKAKPSLFTQLSKYHHLKYLLRLSHLYPQPPSTLYPPTNFMSLPKYSLSTKGITVPLIGGDLPPYEQLYSNYNVREKTEELLYALLMFNYQYIYQITIIDFDGSIDQNETTTQGDGHDNNTNYVPYKPKRKKHIYLTMTHLNPLPPQLLLSHYFPQLNDRTSKSIDIKEDNDAIDINDNTQITDDNNKQSFGTPIKSSTIHTTQTTVLTSSTTKSHDAFSDTPLKDSCLSTSASTTSNNGNTRPLNLVIFTALFQIFDVITTSQKVLPLEIIPKLYLHESMLLRNYHEFTHHHYKPLFERYKVHLLHYLVLTTLKLKQAHNNTSITPPLFLTQSTSNDMFTQHDTNSGYEGDNMMIKFANEKGSKDNILQQFFKSSHIHSLISPLVLFAKEFISQQITPIPSNPQGNSLNGSIARYKENYFQLLHDLDLYIQMQSGYSSSSTPMNQPGSNNNANANDSHQIQGSETLNDNIFTRTFFTFLKNHFLNVGSQLFTYDLTLQAWPLFFGGTGGGDKPHSITTASKKSRFFPHMLQRDTLLEPTTTPSLCTVPSTQSTSFFYLLHQLSPPAPLHPFQINILFSSNVDGSSTSHHSPNENIHTIPPNQPNTLLHTQSQPQTTQFPPHPSISPSFYTKSLLDLVHPSAELWYSQLTYIFSKQHLLVHPTIPSISAIIAALCPECSSSKSSQTKMPSKIIHYSSENVQSPDVIIDNDKNDELKELYVPYQILLPPSLTQHLPSAPTPIVLSPHLPTSYNSTTEGLTQVIQGPMIDGDDQANTSGIQSMVSIQQSFSPMIVNVGDATPLSSFNQSNAYQTNLRHDDCAMNDNGDNIDVCYASLMVNQSSIFSSQCKQNSIINMTSTINTKSSRVSITGSRDHDNLTHNSFHISDGIDSVLNINGDAFDDVDIDGKDILTKPTKVISTPIKKTHSIVNTSEFTSPSNLFKTHSMVQIKHSPVTSETSHELDPFQSQRTPPKENVNKVCSTYSTYHEQPTKPQLSINSFDFFDDNDAFVSDVDSIDLIHPAVAHTTTKDLSLTTDLLDPSTPMVNSILTPQQSFLLQQMTSPTQNNPTITSYQQQQSTPLTTLPYSPRPPPGTLSHVGKMSKNGFVVTMLPSLDSSVTIIAPLIGIPHLQTHSQTALLGVVPIKKVREYLSQSLKLVNIIKGRESRAYKGYNDEEMIQNRFYAVQISSQLPSSSLKPTADLLNQPPNTMLRNDNQSVQNQDPPISQHPVDQNQQHKPEEQPQSTSNPNTFSPIDKMFAKVHKTTNPQYKSNFDEVADDAASWSTGRGPAYNAKKQQIALKKMFKSALSPKKSKLSPRSTKTGSPSGTSSKRGTHSNSKSPHKASHRSSPSTCRSKTTSHGISSSLDQFNLNTIDLLQDSQLSQDVQEIDLTDNFDQVREKKYPFVNFFAIFPSLLKSASLLHSSGASSTKSTSGPEMGSTNDQSTLNIDHSSIQDQHIKMLINHLVTPVQCPMPSIPDLIDTTVEQHLHHNHNDNIQDTGSNTHKSPPTLNKDEIQYATVKCVICRDVGFVLNLNMSIPPQHYPFPDSFNKTSFSFPNDKRLFYQNEFSSTTLHNHQKDQCSTGGDNDNVDIDYNTTKLSNYLNEKMIKLPLDYDSFSRHFKLSVSKDPCKCIMKEYYLSMKSQQSMKKLCERAIRQQSNSTLSTNTTTNSDLLINSNQNFQHQHYHQHSINHTLIPKLLTSPIYDTLSINTVSSIRLLSYIIKEGHIKKKHQQQTRRSNDFLNNKNRDQLDTHQFNSPLESSITFPDAIGCLGVRSQLLLHSPLALIDLTYDPDFLSAHSSIPNNTIKPLLSSSTTLMSTNNQDIDDIVDGILNRSPNDNQPITLISPSHIFTSPKHINTILSPHSHPLQQYPISYYLTYLQNSNPTHLDRHHNNLTFYQIFPPQTLIKFVLKFDLINKIPHYFQYLLSYYSQPLKAEKLTLMKELYEKEIKGKEIHGDEENVSLSWLFRYLQIGFIVQRFSNELSSIPQTTGKTPFTPKPQTFLEYEISKTLQTTSNPLLKQHQSLLQQSSLIKQGINSSDNPIDQDKIDHAIDDIVTNQEQMIITPKRSSSYFKTAFTPADLEKKKIPKPLPPQPKQDSNAHTVGDGYSYDDDNNIDSLLSQDNDDNNDDVRNDDVRLNDQNDDEVYGEEKDSHVAIDEQSFVTPNKSFSRNDISTDNKTNTTARHTDKRTTVMVLSNTNQSTGKLQLMDKQLYDNSIDQFLSSDSDNIDVFDQNSQFDDSNPFPIPARQPNYRDLVDDDVLVSSNGINTNDLRDSTKQTVITPNRTTTKLPSLTSFKNTPLNHQHQKPQGPTPAITDMRARFSRSTSTSRSPFLLNHPPAHTTTTTTNTSTPFLTNQSHLPFSSSKTGGSISKLQPISGLDELIDSCSGIGSNGTQGTQRDEIDILSPSGTQTDDQVVKFQNTEQQVSFPKHSSSMTLSTHKPTQAINIQQNDANKAQSTDSSHTFKKLTTFGSTSTTGTNTIPSFLALRKQTPLSSFGIKTTTTSTFILRPSRLIPHDTHCNLVSSQDGKGNKVTQNIQQHNNNINNMNHVTDNNDKKMNIASVNNDGPSLLPQSSSKPINNLPRPTPSNVTSVKPYHFTSNNKIINTNNNNNNNNHNTHNRITTSNPFPPKPPSLTKFDPTIFKRKEPTPHFVPPKPIIPAGQVIIASFRKPMINEPIALDIDDTNTNDQNDIDDRATHTNKRHRRSLEDGKGNE